MKSQFFFLIVRKIVFHSSAITAMKVLGTHLQVGRQVHKSWLWHSVAACYWASDFNFLFWRDKSGDSYTTFDRMLETVESPGSHYCNYLLLFSYLFIH